MVKSSSAPPPPFSNLDIPPSPRLSGGDSPSNSFFPFSPLPLFRGGGATPLGGSFSPGRSKAFFRDFLFPLRSRTRPLPRGVGERGKSFAPVFPLRAFFLECSGSAFSFFFPPARPRASLLAVFLSFSARSGAFPPLAVETALFFFFPAFSLQLPFWAGSAASFSNPKKCVRFFLPPPSPP